MKVSIIIVNYNTFGLLIECIESIYRQSNQFNFEIIVVDNSSPNREIENLNNFFPKVRLILNPNNDGFGTANNIGFNYALGEYLFFLNSDTILVNNAIWYLLELMSNNSNIGACCGNLFTMKNTPNTSFNRFMPGLIFDIDVFCFNFISKIVYGKNTFFNYSEKNEEINGNISGADFMIKKDVFDLVGRFDENFFMYYEETDLLFRIRKQNLSVYNNPLSKIIHMEEGSESVKERSLNRTLDSKRKYYIKNKSIYSFYISNFINYIMIIQRLIIFGLLQNKAKYNYWKNLFLWANSKIIRK